MAGISRTAAGAPARRMRGGTLVGFMIGLIVGLAVAVVVALFVTRAPVPFVNKAGRASDRIVEPKSAAEAPDPNKPLYSKNRSGIPAETPPPPPPETPEDRASILDRLFGKGAAESAGIPPSKPADTPAVKGDARGGDAKAAPEGKAAEIRASEGRSPDKIADARPADAAKDAAREGTSYLLQAGAFRSQEDADGLKAKLALIGVEARVLTAEVNGQTMYRVRVGPFAQIDDVNKARARLAENGIEASVLRQR